MQINRQPYHKLILLLLAVISLFVIGVQAQNQPAESPPSEELEEPATRSDEQTGTHNAAEGASPANAPPARPVKQFKPTEEIEADAAVSFPIDI